MANADDLFSKNFSATLTEVSKELEHIDGLANGMANNFSKAFRSVISDGKSLQSVLSDIGKSFINLTLTEAFKPLNTLTSGLLDNLFNAVTNIFPHAKGGVISAPTYFPMQGGLGLAGEAGAEAILPLQRGSDGRLGVASGAQTPIAISMTVNAQDARSFKGAEAEMSAMLLRAVRRGRRAS